MSEEPERQSVNSEGVGESGAFTENEKINNPSVQMTADENAADTDSEGIGGEPNAEANTEVNTEADTEQNKEPNTNQANAPYPAESALGNSQSAQPSENRNIYSSAPAQNRNIYSSQPVQNGGAYYNRSAYYGSQAQGISYRFDGNGNNTFSQYNRQAQPYMPQNTDYRGAYMQREAGASYMNQNPYSVGQNNGAAANNGENAAHTGAGAKKLPTGLIVFLVTAFVVFSLCVCLTVAVVAGSGNKNIISQPDVNGGSSLVPSVTEPETEAETALAENELKDTTSKDGSPIDLEKQPQDINSNNAYTAKYAYDKAKNVVAGVVGYKDSEYKQIASQGTGIVISENGYIITNSHVIGDSKQKYRVRVILDGESYDAQVTGFDSRTDIAVLKIDKDGLSPASFADSAELSVGQRVVAIGNPGGIEFSNSVTEGIISALDRDVRHGNVSYIQTDAAINPGNSGGPLLNLSGQVVGITTIKIVNTSYEGMGFAIPSRQIVSVIDSIIKNGYVAGRVRLGITGSEISRYNAEYYGLPTGIYVESVDGEGPAAKSRIAQGDIITEIDGVEITEFSVLYAELDKHSAGDVVTLTCLRYDESKDDYDEYVAQVTLTADEG